MTGRLENNDYVFKIKTIVYFFLCKKLLARKLAVRISRMYFFIIKNMFKKVTKIGKYDWKLI